MPLPDYYPEFHHKIRIIPQGFDFDLDPVKTEAVDRMIFLNLLMRVDF